MGCRFTIGAIRVDDGHHVVLPRIGRVRSSEATTALHRRVSAGTRASSGPPSPAKRAGGTSPSPTAVKRPVALRNGHDDTIGVDLGVLALATLSTGEVVRGPRRYGRDCASCAASLVITRAASGDRTTGAGQLVGWLATMPG